MLAWRIGTRLYLAFGVVIALLAALGMVAAKFARQIASDVDNSVRSTMDRTEHIAALRENARDLHLGYTTLAASAVSNDLSSVKPLEQDVEASLKDLGGRLGEQTHAALGDELAVVEKRGRAWVRRAVDARLEGSNQIGGDGSPTELAIAFNKATSAFEQHLDEVVQAERGRTSGTLTDLTAEIREGTQIYVAGVIACLLIAGVFAFSMRRSVVAPIAQLTRVARRIANEGDLTEDIAIQRDDELGELAGALSELVRRLREIPTELQSQLDSLRVSVDELDRSFVDQELTFTKQAAAIQQSQVTLQEIRQTSTVAAQKAEAVLKVTEHAADVSRSGELALERSLEGLNMIRTGFDAIAENISLLSQKTSQISGITSTVKDIADQSSMLALNAAIEAVRSGEHGRGFSVVAREIRSLADQSVDSTRQVGSVLGDIGHAIREAVHITETGERKIEAGVAQVGESSSRMRELASIVRESAAMVRQIAAAVGQQNEGVAQLLAAVGDVAQMMESARGRLATSAAARTRMKDASERVAGVVAGFRV